MIYPYYLAYDQQLSSNTIIKIYFSNYCINKVMNAVNSLGFVFF